MVIHIENIRYTESTAFDERVQLADKLNEIINALNAWGDVPVDIEARMQVLEDSEGEQNRDIANINGRLRACLNHLSTTATANGVSIGYATDGKPSPQVQITFPVLDGMSAGVMTPAQMQDLTDQLDTLGRDLNNVKAEYLDKYNLESVQLIRSRTDFEREPLIRTVASGDVDKDNGRHAVNYATMKRDAVLVNGEQKVKGAKDFTTITRSTNISADSMTYTDLLNGYSIANVMAGAIPPYAYESKENVPTHSSMTIIGISSYRGAKMYNKDVMIVGNFIGAEAFRRSDIVTFKATAQHMFTSITAFADCASLQTVDLMGWENSFSRIFENDTSLTKLICRNPVPCKISAPNFLNNTPIADGVGFIYVPDEAVEAYKTATNWTVYASQIKPLSALPAEASA